MRSLATRLVLAAAFALAAVAISAASVGAKEHARDFAAVAHPAGGPARIILMRHADKPDDPYDENLSAPGNQRAAHRDAGNQRAEHQWLRQSCPAHLPERFPVAHHHLCRPHVHRMPGA